MNRPSIGWVVTVPSAVRAFIAPYLTALSEDYDVTLYVNGAREDMAGFLSAEVEVVTVDMRREIAPIADIAAFLHLRREFRARRHTLVHSMLPKSGLLAMSAAWTSGIEHRIHLFTGQVWANRRGLSRWLLKGVDRFFARRATYLMADSPSQRDFLIREKVANSVRVIGPGSVCGLDPARFQPDSRARATFRKSLGIAPSDVVIGFLGRINRDKGVPQLLEAFAKADLGSEVKLLIVGPDEEGLVAGIDNPRIHIAGPTNRPEHALAAMDIFVLPSFREGFGVAVLEASATGLPVIASKIYGLTDAVVEGETGWLFPPGDITALMQVLRERIADRNVLQSVGAAGRRRVERDFAPLNFVSEMRGLYRGLLSGIE